MRDLGGVTLRAVFITPDARVGIRAEIAAYRDGERDRRLDPAIGAGDSPVCEALGCSCGTCSPSISISLL